MRWIRVCENAPYFEDEENIIWTPIGQNDALTWPDLKGLFLRKNVEEVEGHFAFLHRHGVNCIRIMLEYCQTENRYLEKPVGSFQKNMVQFWDDFFSLCEKYKIRVLLTPYDTFWMARRWGHHPYNAKNGGPSKSKWQWLSSPDTIQAVKNRFTFAIERWGGSGVIFGWDLWNEIHPKHAGKSIEVLSVFVDAISAHIRSVEMELYGKTHLQTVSVFAPDLFLPGMMPLAFSHPKLDFATTHFYEKGTINSPRTTVSPALTTGNMVRHALSHVPENRPFFDSENGPIDYFKRHRQSMAEAFDDGYFLHMQWAHFASGAAGGGMRWPYRHPHVLTHGMRRAQLNLAMFAELVDWQKFDRKNLNEEIEISYSDIHVFGCGNSSQVILWLLKSSSKKSTNRTIRVCEKDPYIVSIPGLKNGVYHVLFWDTLTGKTDEQTLEKAGDTLKISVRFNNGNVAIFVKAAH